MSYGELMTLGLIERLKLAHVPGVMPNTAQENPSFFYVLQDPLKILFVDDDPILREFASVHLAAENTSITVLGDGVEALENIDRLDPDVILLDLEMPKMDGFEFLGHLRANPRYADTPVIVCTGREDVKAVDRAFQAGATSFVVKPLNWRLLTYQIRYVVRAGRVEAGKRELSPSDADDGLKALVQESSRFLAQAVRKHPDLKADAAPWFELLQSVVRASNT
jgi:CheY-like chemotaxis protein